MKKILLFLLLFYTSAFSLSLYTATHVYDSVYSANGSCFEKGASAGTTLWGKNETDTGTHYYTSTNQFYVITTTGNPTDVFTATLASCTPPVCEPEAVPNNLDGGFVEVAIGISSDDLTAFVTLFLENHPNVIDTRTPPDNTCGTNSYVNAKQDCPVGQILGDDGTTYGDQDFSHYSCIDLPELCPDTNTLEIVVVGGDNVCEVIGEQGSCPDFQVRAGVRLDNLDDLIECTWEVLSVGHSEDGKSKFYYYADGSSMAYDINDNWAYAFDKDGNEIDNRRRANDYDNYTSDDYNEPPTYIDKGFNHVLGVTLEYLGLGFQTITNGPILLMKQTDFGNDVFPDDPSNNFVMDIGQYLQFTKEDEKVTISQINGLTADNNPSTSNDVLDGITLVTKPTKDIDSNPIPTEELDGIEIKEDDPSVPATNTDTPLNSDWNARKAYDDAFANKWGGAGNLGATVYLPSFNQDVAVTKKDGEIVILHKNNDGSVDIVKTSETDMKEAITNQPNGIAKPTYKPADTTIKKIQPPVIQSDGSVTRDTENKSISTTNPETGTTTTTTSTGTTTTETTPTTGSGTPTTAPVTDSNGTTTSEIDLSGVTKRLDTLSHQLSYGNARLSSISGNTAMTNQQLSVIGEKIDKTNELLEDGLFVEDDPYAESVTALDNFTNTFNTTLSNMESSYNNVKGQVDGIVSRLEGDELTTILTKKTVITCPKNFQFDMLDGGLKDIVIDPCTPLSQSREYMYPVSYLVFSSSFISLLFSMLLGL